MPQLTSNPDTIGLAAAALIGLAVMAIGFFYMHQSVLDVLVWVGATAVVSYAAAFLFARYVVSTWMVESMERQAVARAQAKAEADARKQQQMQADKEERP